MEIWILFLESRSGLGERRLVACVWVSQDGYTVQVFYPGGSRPDTSGTEYSSCVEKIMYHATYQNSRVVALMIERSNCSLKMSAGACIRLG